MSAFTRVATTRLDFGGGGGASTSSASQYNSPSHLSHPPPPPPPPPPSSSSEPKKATVFPAELRAYVQRCFASGNAIPGISVEQMQTRLKTIIKQAADKDLLSTTDWNMLPLPQQMIAEEMRGGIAVHPHLRDGVQEMKISDRLTNKATSHSSNSSGNKKRKSSDMDGIVGDGGVPPWRSNAAGKGASSSIEDRITFPTPKEAVSQGPPESKKQKRRNGIAGGGAASKSGPTDLERRRQRFGLGATAGGHQAARERSPSPPRGPVVGTCAKLEKGYFRLTSAPKPETVRPLGVLRETLELLIGKWKREHNYSYICDQFKSVRQDLTVQHIKNDFTVLVYETHAHIALEQRDLGEYNQCQTQLRALYRQGLRGRAAEFLAYRILYFIYTGSRTDMSNLLASLTPADRAAAGVRHALSVRSALALGNYHRFFRLFLEAPDMGPYLMDMFVDRQRLAAMANICAAYKPTVSLRFLTEELAFDSESDCVTFLGKHSSADLLEQRADGSAVFHSGKAGPVFENARVAAFRRIDIKGQI